MSTVPRLRVFVSAPFDVALAPLLGGLSRAGMDAYVSSDVARLGVSAMEGTISAIKEADLVVVILTKRAAQNALFEAGMAAGLGKQLVIVAEPDVSVPGDLQGVLIVRSALDDPAPAIVTVQQIARKVGVADGRSAEATGHALEANAGRRLLEWAAASNLNERDVLKAITEAINGTGAVAVEAPDPGGGWDIGVWADDLASVGGNPLVVEVKQYLDLNSIQELRLRLLAQEKARLGVLVYVTESPSGKSPSAQFGTWFPLLVVSLRDLVEQLQSRSFAEVVRNLRNSAVHGPSRR